MTTTVDLELQKIAEKWVKGATIVPHRGATDAEAAAKALGFDRYEPWMRNLEDKNVRNGALVALDYETGELVAYVGSAEYYATQSRPEFQPQYDVVGQGFRQPGSAFKPFNYVVGIDDGTMTAGDMFMDVGTDFGGGYTPNDADHLERGPVRLRNALQFSLNIPSVKAMALNTPEHVFARAKDFGMTFQSETTDAGLALALGVGRDPAGRPRVRLRHPRQRRSADPTDDDPGGRGPRGKARRGAVHAARRRRRWSARRPPGSSPTSWPATPTAA